MTLVLSLRLESRDKDNDEGRPIAVLPSCCTLRFLFLVSLDESMKVRDPARTVIRMKDANLVQRRIVFELALKQEA